MRTFITVALFLASLVYSLFARAGEVGHDAPALTATPPLPTQAPQLSQPSRDGAKVERRSDDVLDVGILGGVGFPRPLSLEAIARVHRIVMFGAEYSFLPQTSIASVDARLWSAAGDLRVFPFKGGFFIGVRGGYQELSAGATLSAANLGSYRESVDMATWFVNPRMGFLWMWKPFALGIDAGVQIPVATKLTRSSALSAVAPELDEHVRMATSLLGRSVIPTVDLLRVGLVL